MELSSPIDDSGESDCDQSCIYEDQEGITTYVIRLTPLDKYNLEDVKAFMDEAFSDDCWLVAVENVPKLHFHLVIESELDLQWMKSQITAFLYKYWPVRQRGWGNAQYNCQIARPLPPEEVQKYHTANRRALAYALKDRNEYIFCNYEQEFINECLELSYAKKSISNFKVEYELLCKEFAESTMDIREFMIRYVKLKSKYGQQVSLLHAHQYALSNLIRREPDEAENLVENFLYKH